MAKKGSVCIVEHTVPYGMDIVKRNSGGGARHVIARLFSEVSESVVNSKGFGSNAG
ncbi:MAG: hypothetical protein R3F48_14955 [Candidatus Zixiibacteriota bacterium]